MTAEFVWPVRVYWEDTDAGGVVYYANYLKFLERARTEWLRALGVEQQPLKEQQGILLVISRIEADYKRSARYGDQLKVTSSISERGRVSLTFKQCVWRNEVGGELLLEGLARVACVDAETFRPRALPDVITSRLLTGELV